MRRCTCKDFIVAREGMEQRIVSTGMAVRDNEVKRHRNFSKKHFSGVAACGFRLVGHDGGAVWDEAVPVYVTRFGDSAKRQILENGGLVPLFSEIKKFVLLGLKDRLFKKLSFEIRGAGAPHSYLRR